MMTHDVNLDHVLNTSCTFETFWFIIYSISSLCTMSKRILTTYPHAQKRARITKTFHPIKVASQEASAAADASTPFSRLQIALDRRLHSPQKGDCVVYWMRMSDLRSNISLFFSFFLESRLLNPSSQL